MTPIKERLYHKAIESVIKHHIDLDRYGMFCMECEEYAPNREAIKHGKDCGIKRLERIIAL